MKKEFEKIIEENGFNIHKCDNGDYELQQHTPAGEDWYLIYIDEKDFMDMLYNYDSDDDLKMWSELAGTNGTPSVEMLVEDAKWKQSVVDKLYKELNERG